MPPKDRTRMPRGLKRRDGKLFRKRPNRSKSTGSNTRTRGTLDLSEAWPAARRRPEGETPSGPDGYTGLNAAEKSLCRGESAGSSHSLSLSILLPGLLMNESRIKSFNWPELLLWPPQGDNSEGLDVRRNLEKLAHTLHSLLQWINTNPDSPNSSVT